MQYFSLITCHPRVNGLMILFWLVMLTASVTAPPSYAAGSVYYGNVRSVLVHYALSALGTPYAWGGASPRGFDCSGLVQYSYGMAGIKVPRTAAEQRAASAPLDIDHLKPGDLLFFDTTHSYSHVGIYLGDGRFVHAPSRGKDVRVSTLHNAYWSAVLSYAGSFLR